jgi:hypothetical protein
MKSRSLRESLIGRMKSLDAWIIYTRLYLRVDIIL